MFVIKHKNTLMSIALMILLASVSVIKMYGLPLGIDFTGGAMTEVTYHDALPEKSEVEAVVSDLGISDFLVQESNTETGQENYIVKTENLTEAERVELGEALTSIGQGGEITNFNSIGPVMGEELRSKAIWAIGGVILVIVIYIALAFLGINRPASSWVYGGVTISSLIFDVTVSVAFVSLLGHFMGVNVDILIIMSLLAVLTISVNNNIVVLDRVRENIKANRIEKRSKKTEAGIVVETVDYTLTKPFNEIVGEAVSLTLMRSINTTLTILFTLFALYYIGGEVTRNFSLVLIVGLVAGFYSSLCVANPILVSYVEWKEKNKNKEA